MSRFCVSQVSTMYNDGLRAPLSLSPLLTVLFDESRFEPLEWKVGSPRRS